MMTLLLALALDLALGDPPSRWHPVAWVGRALDAGRRRLSGGSPGVLLVGGAALVVSLAAGAAAVVLALERVLSPWPLAALLLDAVLLKGALSVRALLAAVSSVRRALEAGRLEVARAALGRDLVSRPVESLDAGHVASGAIESLAENLTDSLVAPVLFFLLGGVPAAWAYRVVNTADAMLGYHEGELEHLGKAAARLDDALNWLPARLAAAALVAGAALAGGSGSQAWRLLRRDGGNTASPNAGRTMAAMAGGLGVRLVKPGLYTLGDGALPDSQGIGRALRVAAFAAALAMATAVVALAVLEGRF
jgi:adenosylcobinamide-phosphate synthase